jgi:hypothetical protein
MVSEMNRNNKDKFENYSKNIEYFSQQLTDLENQLLDFIEEKKLFLRKILSSTAFLVRSLLVKPKNEVLQLERQLNSKAVDATFTLMKTMRLEQLRENNNTNGNDGAFQNNPGEIVGGGKKKNDDVPPRKNKKSSPLEILADMYLEEYRSHGLKKC